MSSYTIELRNICEFYTRQEVENWFKDYKIQDYLLPNQIEAIQQFKIFDKDRLARDIVDFYYMREIGVETPALFKHYAKVYMRNIMQKYLHLFYSMSLEYNPLVNVDFTETFTRTGSGTAENNGNSNSNSQSNSSGLVVASDTPQGQIDKNTILNGSYASSTSAQENENNVIDNTTTTSNTTSSSKEEYIKNYKGNQGISATYQSMIKQFRANILEINKNIIDELNPLFMGIY